MTPAPAIEAALQTVLQQWSQVRAAWLFGSCADGTPGRMSDVDVAVLGCADFTLDALGRLVADLESAVGRRCDVVVAERASPVLGMEIVHHGRRILCRDEDAADRWEDFAVRRYLGTASLRKMVQESVERDLLGKRS